MSKQKVSKNVCLSYLLKNSAASDKMRHTVSGISAPQSTMTLNYLLLNLNSINETCLFILYFSTYDCVYTDLVLSGCVVILKIFH